MPFNFFRSRLFKDSSGLQPAAIEIPAALEAGEAHLDLKPHVYLDDGGFSRLDWEAVRTWVEHLDSPLRAMAWAQAEIAWLLRLRNDLGAAYRLEIQNGAALVSSLDTNVARSALDFMFRSRHRIFSIFDGIANPTEWGHDILLVFEDDETYYRYLSHFYREDGEFASSGGMFIDDGCSHFVAVKSDLSIFESVIVHEMTHACLSHLPLPVWIHEGLAVNTERMLSPPFEPEAITARQMHEKHLAFWTAARIQEFWSGKSWLRPDDGNLLSYDLARILISNFSEDWAKFKQFLLKAQSSDSGYAAAVEYLGVDLGAAVCAVLGMEPDPEWSPLPSAWRGPDA